MPATRASPGHKTISPSYRQDILTKRVQLTIQRQKDENQSVQNPSSRKRPYRIISSPTLSSSTMRADPSSVTPVDLQNTWEEITIIFPLLSYGEESDQLFLALLGLLPDHEVDAAGLLMAFDCALQAMLRVRQNSNSLRHDVIPKISTEKEDTSIKKRSLPESVILCDIMPWNLLVRVVLRFTSCFAKQLTLKNVNEEKIPKRKDNYCADGDDLNILEIHDNRIHPMLQSLNIVVAELNVILRTERRNRFERQQDLVAKNSGVSVVSQSNDSKHNTAANNVPSDGVHQTSTIRNQANASVPMVQDRMICDWKSRSRCGPSRYAFLKDVDYILQNLNLDRMNIRVEEWQETMHTIVGFLDEYVDLGSDEVCDSGVGKQSHFKSSPSSPFTKSPLTSPFSKSTPSSRFRSPITDITRSHIKRLLNMDKEVRRDSSCTPSNCISFPLDTVKSHHDPCNSRLVDVALEANLGTEDSAEDGSSQLEDSYRMAIAFAQVSGEEGGEGLCETIKRRLELLVQQIKLDDIGETSKCRNILNIDGADSYLRLLLRESFQPSDPRVWARLIKESQGEDTSMLLHKGRSSLVSFLIEIQAPGWDEVVFSLEPSPVAEYLGFLSTRKESAHDQNQENSKFLRSSFLLPVLAAGESSMPSPPIVTEIGFGACVSNFLLNDVAQEAAHMSGIRFVFNRRSGANLPPENDTLLESIKNPLPDVRELTRDLFDLTLRLAATDECEHQSKPLPLRLATPSASESLGIILDVVSDHSDWLEPRSISKSYRLVMELIIRSFHCFDGADRFTSLKNECSRPGPTSYEHRVLSLIKIAKSVENRARIALYATQFVMIVCGTKHLSRHNSSNGVARRPNFFRLLPHHKFRQFWNDIDKSAHGRTTSIMGRIFDEDFCKTHLLPLSHEFSLLLARLSDRSLAVQQHFADNERGKSVQSLVTILCYVFTILTEDSLLADCVHFGWSLEILSSSISSFGVCVRSDIQRHSRVQGSVWQRISDQLKRLIDKVLGNLQSDSEGRSKLSFNLIETNTGNRKQTYLMPSFADFVASLVTFSYRIVFHESEEACSNWCKFVSTIFLDRYAQIIPMKAVAISWIHHLALKLQEDVIRRQNDLSIGSKATCDKRPERNIDLILDRLMNPLLKYLHSTIMGHHGLRPPPLQVSAESARDSLAFAFADLFKDESAKFLSKPSRSKTRRWNVYRTCIEKIFVSTPHATLFTRLGHTTLSESSTQALNDLWTHYGQTYSSLIIVAAGLHVNDSLKQSDLSFHLKQIYNNFTSQVRECIIGSFHCFSTATFPDESDHEFHTLVNSVRRDLVFHSACVGLTWWNELASDITLLLESKIKERTEKMFPNTSVSSKRRGDNIANVFSTLEKDLSVFN